MNAFISPESQKLLLAGVLVISLPDGWAAMNLPTSSTTLNLQTLSPTETSFVLPDTASVTTSQGNGVNGDASRNWQLTIQGVVDAAGSGVSLSSLDGQTTINNLGSITGHGAGASDGGVVLLNGGKLVNHVGSTVTGVIGFNAVNGNATLDNVGTLTGTGGTAVMLNGGNNSVILRSGSTLNGSVVSNSPGNSLTLEGVGRVTGDVGGTTGFDTIAVSGSVWELGGSVMLSGAAGSSLDIADGSSLFFPGTLDSRNRNNSVVNIDRGGTLQLGEGGTTGSVQIPVVTNGQLTFYRSDTSLTLSTPVSGVGSILFKGTGVNGQSSYDISLPVNDFVGTVTVGSGARLHLNPTTFAPKALFAVNDGGTLWLGSSADYGAPVTLEGLGWKEGSGTQYGALRMDSNPVLSGTVLLTGDARMSAIFTEYTGTISGVITDNGKGYQLEKYGDGLIILSGNSTWTGGMLLTDGTLSVSKDSNLGAASGTLVFNGGVLSMTDSFTSQRALAVNSTGGTTTSTGTNTFAGGSSGSGPLTISKGKLVLAGTDTRTGTTTIASGAQLQIGANDIASAGQGTLSGKVTNNGTLTFNRTGASSSSAVLSGPGALIKQLAGLVNLTGAGSTQGSVVVNGGTLMFSPPGAFNVTQNLTTASGGKTSVGASSQLNIGGAMTQQAGSAFEVAVNAQQPAAVAPTMALDGALKVLGAPVSATSITSKSINILHSTTAGGISGDFTSLGFINPADYLTIAGSKLNGNQDYNLTFGMTWFADPSRGNGTFTLLAPNETFNVDVLLTDRAGPFASGWDGQSLTKAGPGTLILSQQNSYTGNTLINGGTLQTNVQDAFASSSAVSVAAGATLNLNNFSQSANNLSGAGAVKLGSAALTVNNSQDTSVSGAITGSGTLIKEGASSLTLSGANTFSGGTSINAGTLVALSGAALGTGTITNNTVMTLAFAGISPVVNLLVGNGTLNKEGAGSAVLMQTGSAAGEVNVNAGALDFGPYVTMNVTGDYTLAQNAITRVARESSLIIGDEFNADGRLSILAGGKEPIVTANTAVLGPQSTLNVAGMNVADGPGFTDYVKTFQVLGTAAAGNISGDFSGVHLGGATSPVDYASVVGYKGLLDRNYYIDVRLNWYGQHSSTPEIANGVFTLTNAEESFELVRTLIDQNPNPVTGWDGKTLTKAGLGTLTLSHHNLYTGDTLIQGGILMTGIDNAFSESRAVTLSAGALLALEGFDQKINNLSGGGNVALGDALLTLNNTSDTLFAGQISGDGGLTKTGSETLIFTGDHLYTGATTVSAGTLQLGNGGTTGSVAGDIVDNASLVFDHAQDLAFSKTISGSGSVTQNGDGDLQFLTNQTWTGATNINSGSLILGTPSAPVSLATRQVNIAPGALLGGYGSVAGSVLNQGTLAVADAAPRFTDGPAGSLLIGGDLVNSGNIVMASPVPASTLVVNGNYTGNNGLLTLSTALGNDQSATDKLIVHGNTRGNTQVKINNAGGGGASTINGIEIIHVDGDSAGKFALQGRVAAGAYDYFLHQGLPNQANGNWYLRNTLPPTPPVPPTPSATVLRPEAGSYLANRRIAQEMFNQRLEDRTGQAEGSSLWLRQTGSRQGVYDSTGQLKTTTNSYMIQGGGEIALGHFTAKDYLGIGVMLGYGNAHSNTSANRSGYRSKGSVDGYSGGFYATWYQDAETQAGTYVDSWVQYGRFNGQVKGDDLAAENYHIDGFSGSLETGYRIYLSKGEADSLYVTPQAQLIWNGLKADALTEDNGTRVDYPNGDSLQSRLGVRLSREGVSERDKASGKRFTVYAETNWLHNSNDPAVSLDGEKVTLAGTRDIGELKLGIEGRVTANLNLWGNVSQQMGNSGYSATSGVMGVRYRF